MCNGLEEIPPTWFGGKFCPQITHTWDGVDKIHPPHPLFGTGKTHTRRGKVGSMVQGIFATPT